MSDCEQSRPSFASTGPLLLPLWPGGLGWLVLAANAVRYRVFAWWYLAALLLFAVPGGRSYYLAPAYPMLLAAGAVACEQWFARLQPNARRWSRVAARRMAGIRLSPRKSFWRSAARCR